MHISRPKNTTTPGVENNSGVFSWWKNRQAKKKEEEEKAAIAIIDKAIENENTFCNMLDSIDFRASKLPKEKLNYKSPKNKSNYGDLEFMAKFIVQEIRRNPYSVSIDVRPLDKVLYQIIRKYKEAIENGHPHQAFAARVALRESFQKIRFRLPQVLPEGHEQQYARDYIKACARHAESWLHLITQAQLADQADENVENQKRAHDKLAEESAKKKEAHLKNVRSDPEKEAAMVQILKGTPFAELSPVAQKLFSEAVELRVDDTVIEIARRQLNQNMIQAKLAQGRVNTLRVSLSNLVLPIDPNAMDHYNDELNAMQERMAKMDQEIEESIHSFDELNERIKSLDELPGAQASREFAAKGIQDLFEQKAAEQNAKLARSHGFANLFEMFGVKTEEEMEQALAEQALLAQEDMYEEDYLEETESELNYAE